jgi:hypothetical protein
LQISTISKNHTPQNSYKRILFQDAHQLGFLGSRETLTASHRFKAQKLPNIITPTQKKKKKTPKISTTFSPREHTPKATFQQRHPQTEHDSQEGDR